MSLPLSVMKQQLFDLENKDNFLNEMRKILIAVTGESDIDTLPTSLSEPKKEVAAFIKKRWLKRTGELPEILEFRKWTRKIASQESLSAQITGETLERKETPPPAEKVEPDSSNKEDIPVATPKQAEKITIESSLEPENPSKLDDKEIESSNASSQGTETKTQQAIKTSLEPAESTSSTSQSNHSTEEGNDSRRKIEEKADSGGEDLAETGVNRVQQPDGKEGSGDAQDIADDNRANIGREETGDTSQREGGLAQSGSEEEGDNSDFAPVSPAAEGLSAPQNFAPSEEEEHGESKREKKTFTIDDDFEEKMQALHEIASLETNSRRTKLEKIKPQLMEVASEIGGKKPDGFDVAKLFEQSRSVKIEVFDGIKDGYERIMMPDEEEKDDYEEFMRQMRHQSNLEMEKRLDEESDKAIVNEEALDSYFKHREAMEREQEEEASRQIKDGKITYFEKDINEVEPEETKREEQNSDYDSLKEYENLMNKDQPFFEEKENNDGEEPPFEDEHFRNELQKQESEILNYSPPTKTTTVNEDESDELDENAFLILEKLDPGKKVLVPNGNMSTNNFTNTEIHGIKKLTNEEILEDIEKVSNFEEKTASSESRYFVDYKNLSNIIDNFDDSEDETNNSDDFDSFDDGK